MSRSIKTVSANDALSLPLVAIPVTTGSYGAKIASDIPRSINGIELSDVLDSNWCQRFGLDRKAGSVVVLPALQGTSVALVSVGASYDNADGYRQAGAAVARLTPKENVGFLLPASAIENGYTVGQALAEGAVLASFNFKKATSDQRLDVAVVGDPLPSVSQHDVIANGLRDGAMIADAANWAKRLISTPAGDMPPRELAKRVEARLSSDPNVKVDVWNESKIEKERLGGLLGVGAGSDEPVRLVNATYSPKGAGKLPHVVLVGKGVCFDSGGLSLKPADSMGSMKTDMSGAAIVMAVVSMASRLGLKIKLTAIAPMTENLTGGSAVKPGDVLRARNGVTMEVLNTDAEGRLILADGLSLATEEKPDLIIDIATLTGAQKVALGPSIAALFTNRDDVAHQFEKASAVTAEKLWRLPLAEEYEEFISSDYADIQNISRAPFGGAITAALFLQHFVGDTAWAHFDIAGPGRSEAERGIYSKGGTAFGARTILEYLRELAGN